MSETRLTRTLNSVVSELNRHADSILREEFDLTYSQFVFLLTLSEKDSVGAGELAKLLSISQPAVSKRLDWFVDKGLVRVKSASEHKSKLLIGLTAKGRKLAKVAAEVLENRFTSAIPTFQSKQLQALETQLQSVLVALRSKPTKGK